MKLHSICNGPPEGGFEWGLPGLKLSINVLLMMRFMAFFSVALLLAVPALAQQRAFECAPGAKLPQRKAEALIDKAQARYQEVGSLRAKFYQYSFLAAMDTSELSSGKVSFLKPGKMRWDYEQPEKQIFLVKDEVLWFYQESEKQVAINDFKEVLISDLPVAFLMGLGNLRDAFTLKDACRNQEGVVLSLRSKAERGKPHEEKSREELLGFKLLVNPATYLPIGAEVAHVGGNLTSILLTDLELGVALENALFEPAFPQGTDVNDLRIRPPGDAQ